VAQVNLSSLSDVAIKGVDFWQPEYSKEQSLDMF